MGSLHEGHLSLIRSARERDELVVVSIFVNPLQFGSGEDLERYPWDPDRDRALAADAGADVLWTPQVSDIYPEWPVPEQQTINPGPVGDVLEGASRPGHFKGVLTVVKRLFDAVEPTRAYFGEKDAQQLFLVRQMVRSLDLATEVVARPTIREPDGLAMSSRNAYLSEAERAASACLHDGLRDAVRAYAAGERDPSTIRARMVKSVSDQCLAVLDYAALVGDRDFSEPAHVLDGGTPVRALIAARFGSTRLIDNMRLN
jgi:pantoate--beta-alanine ligase